MWNNPEAMRRATARLYFLLFLIILAAVAAWVYRSPHFAVKQISMDGDLRYADIEELQQTARRHIRGNIFRADLNRAQTAFADIPWIAKAEVRRRLPDAVEIRLTERIPVAHWDEGLLVDSEGNVFRAEWDEETPLPYFIGEEVSAKNMVEHLGIFRRELAKQRLNIAALTYTARSAWEIGLDNGVNIRLGRNKEKERLKRFAAVWPQLLRPQADRLDYVDMRYADGFAVRHKTAERIQQEKEGGYRPSESD